MTGGPLPTTSLYSQTVYLKNPKAALEEAVNNRKMAYHSSPDEYDGEGAAVREKILWLSIVTWYPVTLWPGDFFA